MTTTTVLTKPTEEEGGLHPSWSLPEDKKPVLLLTEEKEQTLVEAALCLLFSCREVYELHRRWSGTCSPEDVELGGENFLRDRRKLDAALIRCEKFGRQFRKCRIVLGLGTDNA